MHVVRTNDATMLLETSPSSSSAMLPDRSASAVSFMYRTSLRWHDQLSSRVIDMSVYIRVGLDHVVGRGARVGAAAQYALKWDGGQPMGAVIAIFGSSDSQCGVSLVPRAFAVANDGEWRCAWTSPLA